MQKSAIEHVSDYVTRIKKSEYRIDPRIGLSGLIRVITERLLMRVRGELRFPARKHKPFIGRNVRIRSARNVQFGSGVTVSHGAYIDALSTSGVVLGDNTSVGVNTRIECTGDLRNIGTGMNAGKNVGLGTDCFYGCAGGITIGDDTIVGNLVTFHAENHNYDRADIPIRDQGVNRRGISIGSGCWIGAKATILDGARIGDGCIVASGAIVTAGDYPSFGLYGGAPARLLKDRRTK